MRTVVPLTEKHFDSWGRLFEATGHACFCRYWHFEGAKNDWLARCAFTPDENREAARRELATNGETAQGLVLVETDASSREERVLGWMKLTRLSSVPKLRRLTVYRSLSIPDDGHTFVVACVLVHPEFQSQGVADALVAGAEHFVANHGGTSVVALPYESSDRQHDDVLLMGPRSSFLKAQFSVELDRPPYPVLRKRIEPTNA